MCDDAMKCKINDIKISTDQCKNHKKNKKNNKKKKTDKKKKKKKK